jgi:hypothetical protein
MALKMPRRCTRDGCPCKQGRIATESAFGRVVDGSWTIGERLQLNRMVSHCMLPWGKTAP